MQDENLHNCKTVDCGTASYTASAEVAELASVKDGLRKERERKGPEIMRERGKC